MPRRSRRRRQPGAPLSGAAGDAERIAVRRIRALELRCAGATYRQIARALEVSVQTAFADITAELATVDEQRAVLREQLRTLEVDRADAVQFAHWQKAMAGDVEASRIILRCIDARARLLGLVESGRAVIVAPLGDPRTMAEMSTDRLKAKLGDLKERIADSGSPPIDWSAFDAATGKKPN
jgi:hypothetical protein